MELIRPGDALVVVDATRSPPSKHWPLREGQRVTAREVTPLGFVWLREFNGLFQPHRFAKA